MLAASKGLEAKRDSYTEKRYGKYLEMLHTYLVDVGSGAALRQRQVEAKEYDTTQFKERFDQLASQVRRLDSILVEHAVEEKKYTAPAPEVQLFSKPIATVAELKKAAAHHDVKACTRIVEEDALDPNIILGHGVDWGDTSICELGRQLGARDYEVMSRGSLIIRQLMEKWLAELGQTFRIYIYSDNKKEVTELKEILRVVIRRTLERSATQEDGLNHQWLQKVKTNGFKIDIKPLDEFTALCGHYPAGLHIVYMSNLPVVSSRDILFCNSPCGAEPWVLSRLLFCPNDHLLESTTVATPQTEEDSHRNAL
jgi:hypothetical protein